ncbi:type II toxin-antitoxin system RelE/ParE family toxin [Dyella choica]|uniref:Type II toxin-antitoxin system RelE/ParE family toxin n=1 Tax=Dyella choica TaxID=1927959 RepID=A0A432LZ87_9GAMM|nr:type II toxin-antitoxin system RelE/ParE family toxin [Dyella choica]RUL68679.1 type II toxin-antitoxin system RelE/ParE family toxin [Dyella choica]
MGYVVRQTEDFRDWWLGLRDIVGKQAITRRLDRLVAGNLGDVKSVGAGVSELRIQAGPGYRVYYTMRGREIVILLCGGDKGTQQRAKALAKEV